MEKGNTQIVLNPFLVGLRHAGAETDVVMLARQKIEPCIGCFTCYAETPGECIHNDNMPSLMKRISAADLMVLAVPVYLDGMASPAKIMFDRCVTFLDPHFERHGDRLRHPLRYAFPKKLCLVSVCGFPGLHNFDPLRLHMERIAGNLHAEFVGAVLRPAVFSILLTKKYPERVKAVMDAFRTAGEELGADGRISPETAAAAVQDICSVDELMETANRFWDRELAGSGGDTA